MQHPDEGTIHAWLDGALSPEEATSIEVHIAECSECSAMAAEARGLIAASSRIVSALDIVPGGVIPAAKPRRAGWYTNTQLRAAAAVIVVAGASLLIVRNGRDQAAMRPSQSMTAAAPAVAPAASAEKPVEKPVEADKAAARNAAPIAPKTKKVALTAETEALRENSQKKTAADEVVPAAPPPTTSVAASDIRANAARAAKSQPAVLGTVSGAAVTSRALPELRQVRADTTAAVQRTVYQVSPGLEVTLIESSAPPPAAASVSAKAAEGKVAQRAVAPPVANAPLDVAVNSISWTSKLGHAMTLSGSLSKEELQALRFRLPAEKQ